MEEPTANSNRYSNVMMHFFLIFDDRDKNIIHIEGIMIVHIYIYI